MAANFKSRDDHRKQMELEEARKAGLAPAEVSLGDCVEVAQAR